ncbi:hypothetical protein [Maribacter sp. 4U21]|uniref:hypothetical protein n=1 Tax=Maribacter sp. 4U21 TaxID=1889779 RepID=UPI0015D4A43A|nr:hypothetical protein [Maribacter sp. 4U21]
MKKVIIAVMALVFNMFLISCTDDTIAEVDGLYKVNATEGDDGNPPPPPPDN